MPSEKFRELQIKAISIGKEISNLHEAMYEFQRETFRKIEKLREQQIELERERVEYLHGKRK